jgi:uncharacterized membrane protein YsdA (DUF1294 family)
MTLADVEKLLLAWVLLLSSWTFLAFGYDKWQAGRRPARRVPEVTLCLISALGGWPGGFLGLLLFRHKSAKASFQLKFAASFLVWAGLLAVVWLLAGPG